MSRHLALDGAKAVAEAMRQINPDVVAAYPITPQTEIVQTFSQFVADGLVDTEFITVESEHSAMSACVGAAAAGARVMTATSSAGLALMWEILYVAASNRLPIVMPVVNRALSAPINIHCDHSDSMGARDASWIHLFSETPQEVYDNAIQALRIAEHPDVLLPVMVCQDGFITSHGLERIDALEDDEVRQFVGTLQPHMPLLDLAHPVTYGPLDFYDYYFEHKRQQVEAMRHAGPVILAVADEFARLSGRRYGYFEPYRLDDAQVAVIVLNSTAGTARTVADRLRKEGIKAGVLIVWPGIQRVQGPWLWTAAKLQEHAVGATGARWCRTSWSGSARGSQARRLPRASRSWWATSARTAATSTPWTPCAASWPCPWCCTRSWWASSTCSPPRWMPSPSRTGRCCS